MQPQNKCYLVVKAYTNSGIIALIKGQLKKKNRCKLFEVYLNT